MQINNVQVNSERMKLKVISDIHLEKYNEYPDPYTFLGSCKNAPCDIICLCGDIGDPKQDMYKRFLIDCANICRLRTFVVLGNHEFYGSDISSTKKLVYEICAQHDKLVMMDNTVHVVGDITFLGTTMWSKIDSTRMWDITHSINDFFRIHGWTGCACLQEFHRSRQWLIDSLAICKSPHVVLLTHHVPLLGIGNHVHAKGTLESAFASDMSDIITAYSDRIRYWLYGHNHYSEHRIVDGVHVISNQVGGGRFDPDLIIEL